MLIAELELPRLFNSIRCNISTDPELYKSKCLYSHYCPKCGQVFIARFGHDNHGVAEIWRGQHFYCPHCGEDARYDWESDRKYYRSTVGIVRAADVAIPKSMTLRLHQFKEHIRLDVIAQAISFIRETPENVRTHVICETFTFDARTQRTWFRQTGGLHDVETHDISNPFNDVLLRCSMLRYLKRNCRAWREMNGQVALFLKKLREAVCKKVKEVKGYSLASISVPASITSGLMINPIQNIAWRLAATDAPNLQMMFKVQHVTDTYSSYSDLMEDVNFRDMEKIVDNCCAGMSYPQAVLNAFRIPDSKSGRRMIAQKPIYTIPIMKCISLLSNEHARKQAYDNLAKRYKTWCDNGLDCHDWIGRHKLPSADAIQFFRAAKKAKGEAKALPLITQLQPDLLDDAGAMYRRLTPEEQKILWQRANSAKQMHDICVELHWKHHHPDYNLDVPEHIVNRLMMQMSGICFYLPKTYYQLRLAGKELKNCVGGIYPQRMKNGECCIVLVADDRGKLQACIELQDNRIIQAKLFDNEPVWKDPVLLEKVQAWAKEKKLTPSTQDLEVPKEQRKQLPVAV